jgi:hypothetical protein
MINIVTIYFNGNKSCCKQRSCHKLPSRGGIAETFPNFRLACCIFLDFEMNACVELARPFKKRTNVTCLTNMIVRSLILDTKAAPQASCPNSSKVSSPALPYLKQYPMDLPDIESEVSRLSVRLHQINSMFNSVKELHAVEKEQLKSQLLEDSATKIKANTACGFYIGFMTAVVGHFGYLAYTIPGYSNAATVV